MAKDKKRVKAVLYTDYDRLNKEGGPGAYMFEKNDELLIHKCPGCSAIGALPLNDNPKAKRGWFLVSKEPPEIKPSVHHIHNCGWHGFLRKGFWVSC